MRDPSARINVPSEREEFTMLIKQLLRQRQKLVEQAVQVFVCQVPVP